MQIDLPEDAMALARRLDVKGPETVISVGVVVLGEGVEALDPLHDDRFSSRREVGHTARHHELTRNGEVRAPCCPEAVVLI